MNSQDTRVSELEKRSGAAPVYAIRIGEELTVRLVHTGEILSLEEYELKYPDGEIIRVVYEEMLLEQVDE